MTAKKTAAPACPANDVVLSLFSTQANYSARQMPEFQIDVVSTDSQACTLDIGAKHLWLRVYAGSVKVWSSAQCAEGEASLVTELHRGFPTVVPIGWNGQMSGTSCPGPATKVTGGNYTATASDGTQVSNTLTFRIN